MIIPEKNLVKFLAIVVGLFVVGLAIKGAINFFKPNQNLEDLKQILDSAQQKIDLSIQQVNTAKSKINDIDTTLNNFRQQLVLSQQRADAIDSVRNERNKSFRIRTDESLKEIKSQQSGIDLSNNDLPDITTEILKPDEQ